MLSPVTYRPLLRSNKVVLARFAAAAEEEEKAARRARNAHKYRGGVGPRNNRTNYSPNLIPRS